VRWWSGARYVLADVQTPLWRALAVYRVLVLGYAVTVAAGHLPDYRHPLLAGLGLAGLAAWSGACAWAYAVARRRTRVLLGTDLAVACGAILLTLVVQTPQQLAERAPTLPTFWVSASVLAWAVRFGVPGGAAAAAVVSVADLAVSPVPGPATLANIFLLLLTGVVVGYASGLVLAAEAAHAQAAELAAATGERERLARGIHDGVLQVLALFQRRGAELGGEFAEWGRLAAEQERRLRALVVGAAAAGTGPDGAADLCPLLHRSVAERPYATVAAPALPVLVGPHAASELTAAVAEALENVRRHAGDGATAVVLVEDEAGQVTVTVRDDGAGMASCRLADASAEGRLGVAQSIIARMRALGGDAVIVSAPGRGTEVELRLPRQPAGGWR